MHKLAKWHFAKDVQKDILGDNRYDSSYLTSELKELGAELKKRDWPAVKDEVGDVMYSAQMIAHQKTGLNFPMIGADGSIKKFQDRRAIWKQIFKDHGGEFHTDYLKGGSNYARPEKVQKALGMAGITISNEQAAELSARHTTKAATDHHNVYAVKLDWAKMNQRRLLRQNPDRKPELPAVYIGSTGLTPADRFAKHKDGLKGNVLVKRHGLELLPALYEQYNPMPFRKAEEVEKWLAAKLRAEGYTVAGGNEKTSSERVESWANAFDGKVNTGSNYLHNAIEDKAAPLVNNQGYQQANSAVSSLAERGTAGLKNFQHDKANHLFGQNRWSTPVAPTNQIPTGLVHQVKSIKHEVSPLIRSAQNFQQAKTGLVDQLVPAAPSVRELGAAADATLRQGAVRANPQLDAIAGAASQYGNYGHTPLWQRATGLHNNRPDLNYQEDTELKNILNRPDVNALAWEAFKDDPIGTLKDVPNEAANPVTLGMLLRSAGKVLPQNLGTGARWLGNRSAGVGTVVNAAAEMPELSQHIGQQVGDGQSVGSAVGGYLDEHVAKANNVNSPLSWLQSYADSVFHPVRGIGGAAKSLYDTSQLLQDSAKQYVGTKGQEAGLYLRQLLQQPR